MCFRRSRCRRLLTLQGINYLGIYMESSEHNGAYISQQICTNSLIFFCKTTFFRVGFSEYANQFIVLIFSDVITFSSLLRSAQISWFSRNLLWKWAKNGFFALKDETTIEKLHTTASYFIMYRMNKLYGKLERATRSLIYFTTRSWEVRNITLGLLLLNIHCFTLWFIQLNYSMFQPTA